VTSTIARNPEPSQRGRSNLLQPAEHSPPRTSCSFSCHCEKRLISKQSPSHQQSVSPLLGLSIFSRHCEKRLISKQSPSYWQSILLYMRHRTNPADCFASRSRSLHWGIEVLRLRLAMSDSVIAKTLGSLASNTSI
jgi:hypothetical protein